MINRIHEGPIDEATVMAWGYDRNLYLCSQDEDLILGARDEFRGVLARLAMDPACPKAGYCLSIMDFRLMFQVLLKHQDAADQIRQTMGYLSGSDRASVRKFIAANTLRLELIAGGPVPTQQRAVALGTAALNGVSRKGKITVQDENCSWIVQLSIQPLHLHKEWLTISKQSGEYSFRR